MFLTVKSYIVIILVLVYEPCTSKNYPRDYVTFSTRMGRVKGSIMKTRLGKPFSAFRSLTYAEAPIGSLRFKVDSINNINVGTGHDPKMI